MRIDIHKLSIDPRHPLVIGFLYWFCFLTALEPGLVLRAADTDVSLVWTSELVRIVSASILGALATPVLLAVLRRFPPGSGPSWAVLAARICGPVLIAFWLIVVSCLLAPFAHIGDTRPFWVALPDHLVSNWFLMSFVIGGLSTLLHLLDRQQNAETAAPATVTKTSNFLAQVQIKTRGHVSVVHLASVDWIEAQANYVALHCGTRTHLLRESLSSIETQLDPAQFVRIHRSILVATHRVACVTPSTNGDATVRLADGTELRLSRSFRSRLRERMDALIP
jgi:hypothetical protein